MNRLSFEQAPQVRWLVLFTGIATTLFVWPSLADPVNVPKMFVLTILSAWVLGSVVVVIISNKVSNLSLGQWAVIVFALGLFVAALLTDVKYTAFFGASHRNNGAFSYLALATLCMASMMAFRSTDIKQIRTSLLVVGLILTGYGFLQIGGHDPIHWVLIYGPVVGTLGNPDFVSGLIGTSAIATLWVIVAKEKMIFKVAAIVLLILELFILKRTGSIQGLVAFGIGLVILTSVKLWQIKKSFGVLAVSVAGIGFIPIVLGFLDKGPLAAKIFRSTLRNRLDYWHSAINMFKAHPFAGVGLDRLGENYGQYVPQVQIAPAQTTDNAHNVFLQLLGTGGLVVILPYLLLLGVIFWTALRAIKNSRGEIQMNMVALFSVWFGFLLVSFISIDTLGVAVWFWISGGALYGVARHNLVEGEIKLTRKGKPDKSSKTATSSTSSPFAPIVSLTLAIIALVIMVPAWRTSAMLADLVGNKDGLAEGPFITKMKQIANIQPNNVQNLVVLSDTGLRISRPDVALNYTRIVIEKDPRSYFGNYLSAVAYERTKKYETAIPFRIRLTELVPWNTANLLELVRDYVQMKDLTKARVISARLSSLQPGGPDAVAAAALLKG